jgi:hypothetical protein
LLTRRCCCLPPAGSPQTHLHRTTEADELRVTHGYNELEEKSTPKWVVYLNMVRVLPPLPARA